MRKVSLSLAVLVALAAAAPTLAAAAPPQIVSTKVAEESVHATTVVLEGLVNPMGLATTYRFEYLTGEAYEANKNAHPPREAFSGASVMPAGGAGLVGSGTSPTRVFQALTGLSPSTAYLYRLNATNSNNESAVSLERPFATQAPTNAFALLDHRGWETVSPVDKDGGAIQPPGTVSGGGVFQASAGGGSFTFSSADPFGTGVQGAPSGSQYVATRGGGGWTTANITTPLLSGSYGSEPNGVPYQLFSGDLTFGLLSNGERCRGQVGAECPVLNPPLPGSGAAAGYRDYYRRSPSGAYESLLTAADLSHTALGPAQFDLRFAAATPDLAHVVLSSCAALTADATEIAGPEGCDPADQNLYEWSGGGLSLVNLLPGDATGTPGAQIGAPRGAISDDGTRVYFRLGQTIYLREGGVTKTVLGGAGVEFATSSKTDGSIAYLIDSGQLVSYSAATEVVTPITTGSGVEGVLGVSVNGGRVYYAKSGAVFLWNGTTADEVASSALPSDWLPDGGTARVTADGSHLLFLSAAELTGYPSEEETEVFLYELQPTGGGPHLACVSCNPTGEAPRGSARIPGVRSNGSKPTATDAYQPRDLSANGNRVFFETTDALASQDTNKAIVDVYEWEAAGEGTCGRFGGCVQLISGGRDLEPSYFLDANQDGSEAFFLTAASLYPLDPGSYDVYDAREGGGFPVPEPSIPCVADACQVLPEAPEDPSPGTLVPNSGNPTLKVAGQGHGKAKGKGKKRKKKHHAAARSKYHGKRRGPKQP